jgi:hypothetical protein
MTLKANVRLYGPTSTKYDGVSLTVDHEVGGIGDADGAGDGEYIAYVDLDYPGDYEVHMQQSSALDLTGTLDDFRWFAQVLLDFVGVNEAEILKQEIE